MVEYEISSAGCCVQSRAVPHILTISGLAGNLTVPAVHFTATFSLALTSTFFPELREDSNYTINVRTCTAYVCEETPASVTVGRAISTISCNVLTVCVFCTGLQYLFPPLSPYKLRMMSRVPILPSSTQLSPSTVCLLTLALPRAVDLSSLTDGTWEEIDILRLTAGETVNMECAQTSHTW